MSYWEKDDSLYWCKQLGDTRVQFGNMAYRKIQAYERQRNYREKYTLPDNEIKQFWTTNLKRLIVDTEKVIYEYSNLYLNNELPYERLKEKRLFEQQSEKGSRYFIFCERICISTKLW